MTIQAMLGNAVRALGHDPILPPADLPYGICMVACRRDEHFPDHRLHTLAEQFGLRWEPETLDGTRYWVLQQ